VGSVPNATTILTLTLTLTLTVTVTLTLTLTKAKQTQTNQSAKNRDRLTAPRCVVCGVCCVVVCVRCVLCALHLNRVCCVGSSACGGSSARPDDEPCDGGPGGTH